MNKKFTKKQLFDLEFKYDYLKKNNNLEDFWYLKLGDLGLAFIIDDIDEEFLEEFNEFFDRIAWDFITIKFKMSENFIRKFQNKLNLNLVLNFQKLSKEFINEIQNKIQGDYNIE